MQLAEPIALHDVRDVEAFVRATIRRGFGLGRGTTADDASQTERTHLLFTEDEREELVCEGICIMLELAAKYEPRREGYAQDGRFSGYAARYLPRRLGEAWHRSHPEHRYVTGDNGKREWRYFKPAVSLNGLNETDPGRTDRLAVPADGWIPVPAAVQA